MEAIHLDWAGGAPMPGVKIAAEQARKFDLAPKQVTAALVGLKNRAAVFAVQRQVAEYDGEPLMAVLPGVALDELWDVVGVGEKRAAGACRRWSRVVSLAGLVAVVLAGLNERRRELAVLRAVGAGPRHVLLLLAAEGALVTLLGAVLGALPRCWSSSLAGALGAVAFRHRAARCRAPTASQWTLLGAVARRPACWPAWCRAGAPTACRWPTACRREPEHDDRLVLDRCTPRSPLACWRPAPARAAGRPPPTPAAPARQGAPSRQAAGPAGGLSRHHLGRTGAQGLGPVQGHSRTWTWPALSDADPRAAAMLKRMREVWDNAPVNNADGRPGGAHPGLRGAAGRRQGRHEGVPARALLRRLHPHPAAAVEPDHPRAAAPGGQGLPLDGHGVGQRHAQDAALRHRMGTSSYRLDAVSVEPYVDKPK